MTERPGAPARKTDFGAFAPQFSTRSPLRLHGDIANHIGRKIVGEIYRSGELLPGEVEFSEKAKVSRTAYREALRMLAAKGLVESRPKTGTRVSQRARWNFLDPDIVRWFFEDGEPQDYYLDGLFELRLIVEPAAAEIAARRHSAEDLADIDEALAAMKHHTLEFTPGQEADRRFHAAILKATGNPVIMSLASGIGAAVNWTTRFKYEMRRLPRDPIVDHEAVRNAIADADAAAARATMEKLVNLALSDIRKARKA